jgi:hypothetical protein
MIDFLIFSSLFITFLPPLFAWYRFLIQPKDLKLLSIFFFITLFFELGQYYLYKQRQNNIWLINLFALFEGVILIYWLYLLNASTLFRRFIIVSVLSFFSFWVISTFHMSSIYLFNDDEKTLKCLILIIGSCYVLIHFAIKTTEKVYKEYNFWMLTGVLFYFTLCLVIYATSKFNLSNNKIAYDITFPIQSAINVITNIIFTFGYICFIRKTNSSS